MRGQRKACTQALVVTGDKPVVKQIDKPADCVSVMGYTASGIPHIHVQCPGKPVKGPEA